MSPKRRSSRGSDPEKIWTALARESSTAAEHICIGAMALGRANHAHHAYYGQAFFALSVGFERAAKIAISVDAALSSDGDLPSQRTLRQYGHDLSSLMERVDAIAEARAVPGPEGRLPREAIHTAILGVLSDFATNKTRYYNFDLLAGSVTNTSPQDPVADWYNRVTAEIIRRHLSSAKRAQFEREARSLQDSCGSMSLVIHTNEVGDAITDTYGLQLHGRISEFAKPFARMYVLQIARFLATLLRELGAAAQSLKPQCVPYLGEFFAVFEQTDRDFRTRKTWTSVSG